MTAVTQARPRPVTAVLHAIGLSGPCVTARGTGGVVGVLDFDDVAWDHPVSDLAKAGVYLSTRFTDWRPTPDAVRRHLRQGYESVRPLSSLESRWLEALTLWQGILAIPHSQDPDAWARAL